MTVVTAIRKNANTIEFCVIEDEEVPPGLFEIGSTVQANTKGIWIMCRPDEKDAGRYFVYLDTEGLADVSKVITHIHMTGNLLET